MHLNKKIIAYLIFVLVTTLSLSFWYGKDVQVGAADPKSFWWSIQSIDTMKYSRDPAREKKNDLDFRKTIDAQVKAIAETGATHIAIGTPYDDEFIPFLRSWIDASRKYGLKIWFRGNFSGWEGWFDYPPIGKDEHLAKIKTFISDNRNLFENGDIFTPCVECENGGSGDPRDTKDVDGFRKFLIDEYKASADSFKKIRKDVKVGYFSMNGDVAKLVMDKDTTRELGGVVVVDHYVSTPQKLEKDLKDLADASGGKIVLGEFGVPIDDIHGKMTDDAQAKWISEALTRLTKLEFMLGVNYWTSVGGATEIWNKDGQPKKAVSVIKDFFAPKIYRGRVIDELDKGVAETVIDTEGKTVLSDGEGNFILPYIGDNISASVSHDGYKKVDFKVSETPDNNTFVLKKEKENWLFKFRKFLYKRFKIRL